MVASASARDQELSQSFSAHQPKLAGQSFSLLKLRHVLLSFKMLTVCGLTVGNHCSAALFNCLAVVFRQTVFISSLQYSLPCCFSRLFLFLKPKSTTSNWPAHDTRFCSSSPPIDNIFSPFAPVLPFPLYLILLLTPVSLIQSSQFDPLWSPREQKHHLLT